MTALHYLFVVIIIILMAASCRVCGCLAFTKSENIRKTFENIQNRRNTAYETNVNCSRMHPPPSAAATIGWRDDGT